ncbi:MAG: M12 family metallo-peptidase [Bacteroidota bacterium]
METRILKTTQLLTAFWFIILTTSSSGQILLKPTTEIKKFINQNEIEKKLIAREVFVSYNFIDIDLNVLTRENEISANFDNSEIRVKETHKFIRNIRNYSWFGRSADFKSSIMISVNNGDIQGMITKGSDLFKIETIENKFILIKINQSILNKKECGVLNDNSKDNFRSNEQEQYNNSNRQKSVENFDCKIRVLVLYTPNASANVSNMTAWVQLCVDQMNQTFINSQVYAEVELVHVQLTNYTETNIMPTNSATHDNDLTRFTNDGDGFMDEVHDLRREYSADICVLISDIPEDLGLFGIARSIKSSSQNSFCIVDYWYSFLTLTFSHEIGHLIGCRHNEGSDPTNSPYAYGHGYTVNDPSNGSWRTIMGTNASCDGCPRNPYWSNPNVSIPFGVTGTVNTNDNARVINENIENVISHRPTNGTLQVNQSKADAAIGNSIYNSNKITTNGSVVINSTQSLALYAGNEIELLPGFTAETGSEFVAQIVPSCGTPDGLSNDYELSADLMSTGLKNSFDNNNEYYLIKLGELKVNKFDIYPNPSIDEINLKYSLVDKANEIKIKVCNYNGQILSTIFKGNKENGIHTLKYSLSSFASGTYFIVISINNSDIVSHKIIKQ